MDFMQNDSMGYEDMNMNQPDDEMNDNGFEDEESVDDPKKNIQRLAGELSQALRLYNDGQETPDTDLNKYAVGMVATQATKNMTSKEKNEIIKKIENGEDVDIDDGDDTQDTPMEECKQNNVMNDEKDGKRFEKKSMNLKNNPFSSQR